jgi:hypothetical protein
MLPGAYLGGAMKKKTAKKLALAKETVRSLEETWTLKEVGGGETASVCHSFCNSACVICDIEPMY